VGIGIATPQATLDVRGSTSATVRIGATENQLTPLTLFGAVDFFNSDLSGDSPQVAAAIRAYTSEATAPAGYLSFQTADFFTVSEGAEPVERIRIWTPGTQTGPRPVLISVGRGYETATPVNTTIAATQGVGTDIAGTNLIIQGGRGTGSGTPGYLAFATSAALASGTTLQTATEKMRITSAGNVKIGGTADRATTEGTNQLVLFNGTAPVGTLANGVSFYSSSGEANVMDAAGNATLLSPHDQETNEWIFRSKHTPTGKVLKIDVERMLRFINDHFGLDMIQEFTEA